MLCQKLTFFWVAIFALSTFPCALAQFEDASAQLGNLPPVPTTYNGNGVSFADFNNDGWDDLAFGRGTQAPAIFLNVNGQLEPAPFTIPNSNQRQIHALLWVDYDADGDNDLLITKELGPVELWQNDGSYNFVNVAAASGIEQLNLMYNGAAFADFDHDGDLDLYLAKFYHPTVGVHASRRNVLYRNNGDGSFTDITESAGVMLGQRPCFQPLFLDYNNDGWEDLYLITDRVFVENALFINNQDGSFTNVTADSGAGIMICSMTGSVADFDNDHDLDVFISNSHVEGSKLMRNNGNGTFTESADDYGLNAHQLGWGAVWLDYDNNGWDDLFMGLTNNGVTNFTGNQFYRNNGSGLFTDISTEIGIGTVLETYVCAKADFDHDGRYDLMTNNDADHSPRLFRNISEAGSSISLVLEGVVSNSKGIGAWMTCHMGDLTLSKQKLCGENLNAQEGDRIVFGTGDVNTVDSLVIEWNSGIRDVYYAIDAGTHIHAIEGHSQYSNLQLQSSSASVCAGESVTLSVGDFGAYEWSTGETSPEITVWESGNYTVTVTTEAGYSFTSEPLAIAYPPVPQFSATVVHQQCYGMADASVQITVNGTEGGWLWIDGVQSSGEAENLMPGYHPYTYTDAFGCTYTDSVLVVEAQPIVPFVAVDDALCFGEAGSAGVIAFGGTAPYTYDWGVADPSALLAGLHAVVITDAHGCTVNVPVIVEEPDALELGLMVANATETALGSAVANPYGGTPPYTIEWSTGDVTSMAIFDLSAGNYSATVTDANGCSTEQSFEVQLMVGIREAKNTEISLYPNPAATVVNLAGCQHSTPTVQIFELGGRQVLQATGTRLDVSNLSSGHYLAIVECDGMMRIPLIKLP